MRAVSRLAPVALAALLALLFVGSASGAEKDASTTKAEKPPPVEARAWALVDARTGKVIESHAGNRHLPIASTTKLMTAYVSLQELPLDKIVRAQPYDPIYGESLLNLRPGQKVSIRDLLYGLILRSGNDAAYDLADAVSGSESGFVREMNRRAAALGLSDTHYANPIGLDQRGNYSTALDLAALTRHLLRIPAFAKIADARSAELKSLHPQRRITSINELLRLAPWVTGVKTGHTFDADYALVGAGRRKGVELISVILGAPSDEARFEGSLELLEEGFKQYRRHVPVHRGEEVASASIRYSGGDLPLRAAHTVAAGTYRGQVLDVDVKAPDEVEGPVRKGAVLGHVTALVDGKPAGTTALLAGRAIPAAGTFDRVRSFVEENTILTLIAVFVILIGAGFLGRRLTRRRARGADGTGGRAK